MAPEDQDLHMDRQRAREDHDDDDDEQENPQSVTALEERRKEILARLRVTTNALRDAGAVTNGYDDAFFLAPPPPDYDASALHERFFRRQAVPIDDVLWHKLSAQRFAFDPPDRVRLEWRVNDLGREKCRELWALFDVDGDDLWSYSDFVEYWTAIEERMDERLDLRAIGINEEVWRMTMHDGFAMDEQHRLTFDGFLRCRETMEDQYPLIRELHAMEINVEWQVVQQMRRVLQLVNEYFGRDDVLPFKSVQFLLAECGTTATYQELWQTIQRQRLFHRCHRFLLAQKRALRLFGYKQKTAIQLTTPALEDDSRVCRAGLLSLILSGWTPIERTSTPERELGDYVFKVEVGSSFTTHSTINATYYSDADSAATLHELKYLERGAECFLYVDFLCRPGTREADAQSLIQKLNWFVELFLKDHIELLPFLFKWFFTIPSKMQLRATGGGAPSSAAGAAPIIRLVVLFTGEMDLYAVLQSLKLPSSMQFDHLLQRLSMRWMFSHSIEELLTNKRFVAGSQWFCRGQLDARFNRQAWGQIFRQCAMAMDDVVTKEREEKEFMASQREQQRQDQRATRPTRVETPTSGLPSTNRQGGREHDLSTPWIEWLHRLAIFVDSSKELSLTWSFRDLCSILEGNAWVKTAISSSTFQRFHSLLTTAGACANEWKNLGDSFRAEFAESRFVTNTLAATAASAFPAASSVGMRGTPNRSGLSSADDWQNSPPSLQGSAGHASVAASFPFATPVSTPAAPRTPVAAGMEEESDASAAAETTKEDPVESDLLELYEMSVKTLQSIHAVRAEAGTSGLSVTLEGWNVFSILPRVVPKLMTRRSVIRTKSTMSNNSDGGVSTASSSGTASSIPTTSASTSGSVHRRPDTQS